MGDMVIVAYRPKPGTEVELLELARDHVPFLRRFGLATDRAATVMQHRDGAMASAHATPEVVELWSHFAAVCDYVPLHELPETSELFATFRPIDP